MRRRPPSPRALTRSLPWYALAALITVTLYWNFDAHVEAHGEPGVDLMARQEIARITERVRMLEDLGVSGLRSLRTKTERDPEKEQASRGDLLPGSHRPKLIAFESKILQGKRPEALYDVVEFCAQRGYKAVGPVMANHVCVRGD